MLPRVELLDRAREIGWYHVLELPGHTTEGIFDLRPYAERLITFAKRGDLHARRQMLTVVTDKTVVHNLFAEIGPSFASRDGGYTRITKVGPEGAGTACALIRPPHASPLGKC